MTLVLYTLFFQYDWPLLLLNWSIEMLRKIGFLPVFISNQTDTNIKKKNSASNLSSFPPSKKKKQSKKLPSKKQRQNKLKWKNYLVLFVFTIYFAIQIMVPCLHLLHQHSAIWEGQTYFGWRMMMVICCSLFLWVYNLLKSFSLLD